MKAQGHLSPALSVYGDVIISRLLVYEPFIAELHRQRYNV
jgi:hypothetical protein